MSQATITSNKTTNTTTPTLLQSPTLRIELFPHSLPTALDFYTRILAFNILRHEPDSESPECTTGYAHLRIPFSPFSLGLATKPASSYPAVAASPEHRAQFRIWPTGAELVLEVGGYEELMRARQKVLDEGWEIDTDLVLQEWGLRDFRIRDPDGYYWRLSERGEEDGTGGVRPQKAKATIPLTL